MNQLNIAADIRILLVIDSGATRDILGQGLRRLGLRELEMVPTGMEAIKHLSRNEFYDLVMCDKNLPDMNGLEVLRELQESDKIEMGSFVLISNEINKADITLAAELGCDAYLVKPFPFRELANKISSAMKRSTDLSCAEALIRVAKNLMVKGEFRKSLKAYKDLIANYGESARLCVGLGRAERKLGQLSRAKKHFSKAISLNSLYVHAFQELGFCLLEEGTTDEALKQFEKAIAVSPKNPARYEIVADILFKAKEFTRAEHYLLQAIKLELAYPDLYAQLGKTLFAQKKPEKAAQFFEKALRRDPKNTSFLNSLGICYKDLGKTKEALDKYNLALKINPADVKVLFNKALCLLNLNDFDRARKTLELILKHDPSYEKAKRKLQDIGRLQEEYERVSRGKRPA